MAAMVITRGQMMEGILKASPGFAPIWRQFLSEWEGQEGELPIYVALSDLARHIAHLHDDGAELELKQIFAVVESWHLDGDAYVKEAATVGLLEDLQNANVVGDAKPPKFVTYLGPETLRWWAKVENFWAKGELIRDD